MALTDSTGTVQTQYTYGPFGTTTASGVASTNPFQYTGRENDGTGLYYYRARYYSLALARFISEDIIGCERGISLFEYVGDDPIDYVDPLGLAAACTPEKRRFFNWLNGPLTAMAAALGTSKVFLLAQAAAEGGWTDADLNYNIPLNNPFGVGASGFLVGRGQLKAQARLPLARGPAAQSLRVPLSSDVGI